MSGDTGLFDIDGNGDAMPATDIRDDEYYELDGNGDVQPK